MSYNLFQEDNSDFNTLTLTYDFIEALISLWLVNNNIHTKEHIFWMVCLSNKYTLTIWESQAPVDTEMEGP